MVFLLKELVFLVILASAVSLPWIGPLVEFADDPDNQEQPSQVIEVFEESPTRAQFADDLDNQEQSSRVIEPFEESPTKAESADDPSNQEQPAQFEESPTEADILNDPGEIPLRESVLEHFDEQQTEGSATFTSKNSVDKIKLRTHSLCGFGWNAYTRDQPQPGYFLEVERGPWERDEPVSALKSRDHRKRSKRNAIPKQYLWKKINNVVTIRYKTSSLSSEAEQELKRVIAFFRRHTCINFVKLSDNPGTDYIEFNGGMSGCSSDKGHKGGGQITYLGSGCHYRGHIMHEIMHSLGFLHEQNRSDRDKFITINWDNIATGFADQFDKENGDNQGYPYDYKSVMSYQSETFAKSPSLKTMVSKDPNNQIGDMTILDAWDIEKVNKLYGCPQAKTKYKNHVVTFITSDSFLAGTDAIPWLRLIGTNKKKTQFERVTSGGRIANENERGAVESHLIPFEDIGEIASAELWLLPSGETPQRKRSIGQPVKKWGWFDGWAFKMKLDGHTFGGGELGKDEKLELSEG